MLSYSAAFKVVAPFNAVEASGNKVRLIKVDLPEPETPVTQVIKPSGMVKSTLFRLLPRAPFNVSTLSLLKGTRCAGISIRRLPDINCPVMELGLANTCSGVPCAMTWPPCTPAPGPISIK